VSTFVVGSVVPVSGWDARLLLAHARQLAKLHNPEYDLSGPVGGQGSVLDLAQEFQDGFQWWQQAHPEITDEPGTTALATEIRDVLAATAADFEGIRYSFIHGDLVATNVLVDSSGIPRYIDWEWARIGDVAQDLAYIGGTVVGGPWYAQMDASMVDRFLAEYMRAAAESSPGRLDSFQRLRRRRDAWELYERFLSSLHYMKQARELVEPGPYPQAVRTLHATLRTRLRTMG
jgi:thiamine kinase-like enzyme